jgi:toxin ParE1/3/4
MRGSGYRLSPLAESDLEDIWLHTFKTWSAEQADRYHRGLVTVFEDLATGRKIGRPVDIRDGYLKCVFGSHVVYFRPSSAGIDVIRVLHGRMDANRHL